MAIEEQRQKIKSLQLQIDDLKKSSSGLERTLEKSSGGFASSGEPSSADVATQRELKRVTNSIQRLENEKLKSQWYPEEDKSASQPEGKTRLGLIGRFTDAISKPAYFTLGGVKHLAGQSKESNLFESMYQNMVRDKSTGSQILRASGVNKTVAAPLGFALDILVDPVNWATAGTAALIPRIGAGVSKGFVKGGVSEALKGGALGLESGVLKKATTLAKYTPVLRKRVDVGALAERSLKKIDEYENLTGTGVNELVRQRGMGVGSYRLGLESTIDTFAAVVPGGEDFLRYWRYSPSRYMKDAWIKDTLRRTIGIGVSKDDMVKILTAKKNGEDIAPLIADLRTKLLQKQMDVKIGPPSSNIPIGPELTEAQVGEVLNKLSAASPDVINKLNLKAVQMLSDVEDASAAIMNPKIATTLDGEENARRLAAEARDTINNLTMEDVQAMIEFGVGDKTGVQWYDKLRDSVYKFTVATNKKEGEVLAVGKEMLDFYDQSQAIFKKSVVTASPTAWVNGVFGNPVMRQMVVGGGMVNYLKRLKQSWDVYRDADGAMLALGDLLANFDAGRLRMELAQHPTAVKGTFGTDRFLDANYVADKILSQMKDLNLVKADARASDVAEDINKVLSELRASLGGSPMPGINMDAGTSLARKIASGEKAAEQGVDAVKATGYVSTEILEHGSARRLFNLIEQKANTSTGSQKLVWQTLNVLYNKVPNAYEKIDQAYKMATFLESTIDGYSKSQILRLKNFIDLEPEDLIKYIPDGGSEPMYRLSAFKGMELSNVVYMNYAAMPAAIKVLRQIPLLGSPFASFMYGMGLKTFQTMAYNPAFFNKMHFALKEFGGQPSPIEKKALDSEYYSYLNESGFMRLPFFKENPVYINLQNMLPYYSLNMFQPSNTNFPQETARTKLVEMWQKAPFMKDPAGQVLFDYMIQPVILGEAIQPQGSFGQPLYPYGANVGTKGLYATRQLGEAFVPGVIGAAGLITPERYAELYPKYRWRQIARAKAGKDVIGRTTSEGKVDRTVRSIMGLAGIPLQRPINLNFVDDEE